VKTNLKRKKRYASKIEKKSDNSDSGDDQLESLPHIEPPFWGTSEILVWDSASLLDKINKEKLFKAAWGWR
jgi:cobalamin-dependent methionine synthase I